MTSAGGSRMAKISKVCPHRLPPIDHVASFKLCCLKRLHSDLEGRVSQQTLLRYRKAVHFLLDYLNSRHDLTAVNTPDELIDIITQYRDEVELSRANHNTLISALQFHIPRWKSQFTEAKEAIKGRLRLEPVDHTVPFAKGSSILFAGHMSSLNEPRMVGSLLIQRNGFPTLPQSCAAYYMNINIVITWSLALAHM